MQKFYQIKKDVTIIKSSSRHIIPLCLSPFFWAGNTHFRDPSHKSPQIILIRYFQKLIALYIPAMLGHTELYCTSI